MQSEYRASNFKTLSLDEAKTFMHYMAKKKYGSRKSISKIFKRHIIYAFSYKPENILSPYRKESKKIARVVISKVDVASCKSMYTIFIESSYLYGNYITQFEIPVVEEAKELLKKKLETFHFCEVVKIIEAIDSPLLGLTSSDAFQRHIAAEIVNEKG